MARETITATSLGQPSSPAPKIPPETWLGLRGKKMEDKEIVAVRGMLGTDFDRLRDTGPSGPLLTWPDEGLSLRVDLIKGNILDAVIFHAEDAWGSPYRGELPYKLLFSDNREE